MTRNSHRKGKTLIEEYNEGRAKEIREKLRKSHLNQKPWNKGLKGLTSWNKGLTKKNDKRLYYKRPTIFKKGNKPWNTGKKRPDVAGENHWNWQGGTFPYSIDFNEKFKEKIRERDNHCCTVCNRLQEDLEENLSIHHIDYDKKNCFPQNCVSLCRKCHSHTNINRIQWKIFFQYLLTERYNYKYTLDQKIILDFVGDEI